MPARPSNSYLYFTRKDRRGTLVLLTLVLLCCIFPFIYPLLISTNISEENKFDSALATLRTRQQEISQKKFASKQEDDYRPYDHPSSAAYITKPKGTLFYFDPNSLSADGWKRLGLRDKTIATILNYRSKGGKFREPGDIKKVWGLFPDEAERLIPFIRIESSGKDNESLKNNFAESQPKVYETKKKLIVVEINEADTAAFIALPGIGSKLSQRIINFRDKLGGFYSVEQVGETFGLPDSTFQKIKPLLRLSGEVKKININSATLDEMKTHPYIKYLLANAIVQYKTQHGNYKAVEDIKKIMIMNEESYNKMAPYLTIE